MEVQLSDKYDFSLFESISKFLESELNVRFKTKHSGHDHCFWDFEMNNCQLTLHLDCYMGICIFPTTSGEVISTQEAETLHHLEKVIKDKFHEG